MVKTPVTPIKPKGPDLRSFKIFGLHGSQKLEMNFPNNYSIFLADNGSGKTTALFILQSVLRGNLINLRRFSFDEIILEFNDGEPLRIDSSMITPKRARRGMEEFVARTGISPRHIDYIFHLVTNGSPSSIRNDEIFRLAMRRSGYPSSVLIDRIQRYLSDGQTSLFPMDGDTSNVQIKNIRNRIISSFPHKIIYLPTYRRIEHDLDIFNDGNTKEDRDEGDLHFGMRDVQRRITSIGEEIRSHAIASYGKTSGQMLSQLVNATQLSSDMQAAVLVVDDVKTVLGRVGDSISNENKSKILKAVADKSILTNTYLTIFIFELIASYKAVSNRDTLLRKFADVCNSYLIDKFFHYDNVRVKLTLENKRTGQELELEMLSSGEKQILGMMAEVYLGSEESYAIFFDEPELSLSVEWQKKILIDLIESDRCAFLAAATHSPFVFDNSLAKYARTLKITHIPKKDQ